MAATTSDEVKVKLKMEKAANFQHEAEKSGKAVEKIGKNSERAAARAELFGKANEHVNRTLNRMGTLLGFAELGLGAALVEGAKQSMEAFQEMEKANAQTNAVIKSTGHAANVSAEDIHGLSESLAESAGIMPDLVQSGANVLLTFTQIRNGAGKTNKVFDKTTGLVLDMATAMHMDLKSAAVMVGKAMNNPADGLGRLQRVGVQFTHSQQKQIKALGKAGKTMKAQKIILGELRREFGGSAKAAGETTAGAMNKLRVAVTEVKEQIGQALAPSVARIAKRFADFAIQVRDNTGQGARFRAEVMKIANTVKTQVIPAIKNIVVEGYKFLKWTGLSIPELKIMLALWAGFAVLIKATMLVARFRDAMILLNAAEYANPVMLIIVGIVALVAAFVLAYNKVGWFRRAVNSVWSWIKEHWPLLVAILMGPFGPAFLLIYHHFNTLVSFVKKLPHRLASAGKGVANWLKTAFRNSVNWCIDRINWLIRALNNTVGRIPGVGNIGEIHKLGAGTGGKSGSGSTSGPPSNPAARAILGGQAGKHRGAGTITNPFGPVKLDNHVHVRLDSKDITHSTLKATRDKARRR